MGGNGMVCRLAVTMSCGSGSLARATISEPPRHRINSRREGKRQQLSPAKRHLERGASNNGSAKIFPLPPPPWPIWGVGVKLQSEDYGTL
jgi:hypothetical protein